MRLTLSAMSLPALALGALMMQATPVLAQAAAPTTGPTAAPATSPPVTTPSPATNALPSTPPSAAGTTKPTHRQSMDVRFKAANTSNDGNLTLEQAKAANWSYVTKNFTAIDKGGKGYVTTADIHAFAKARHAARHHSSTSKATGSTATAPAMTAPATPTPAGTANPPPLAPQ